MTKFRKVTIDIDINASKAEVWDLLFNRFGEVNNFNPLIEGSNHRQGVKGEVGCERVCDLDAKNSIHEKIVAARGNESFDVDIIKGGLPMMGEAKATIDLKEINGTQTNVTFTMNFTSKPAFMAPLMKGMMAKMLKKMLVGLKYHLETDELVTKSNINSIMKSFRKLQDKEAFTVKELAFG
jgi:hypothetical protein